MSAPNTSHTMTASFVEPEPIIARALPRPQFNNCHVGDFRLWFAENEKVLVSFYNSLTPYVFDGEPLDDYFRWTVMVHEVEQMRVEAGLELSATDLEATMCTCHGLERAGEPCVDNCGKVKV